MVKQAKNDHHSKITDGSNVKHDTGTGTLISNQAQTLGLIKSKYAAIGA